jgi:hypothetical protein
MSEAKDFVLDTSLRQLVPSLRALRNSELMAVEFKHRGKTYRADTPKEAVELRALLEKQDADSGIHRAHSRFWTADQASELLDHLGELQKRLLAAISNGTSVPSDTLRRTLKLDSEIALAGVLSGLSKQVRKLEINPHDLYSVEVEWDGRDKVRYFRIKEDFSSALSEIGWPEDWKDEKQHK